MDLCCPESWLEGVGCGGAGEVRIMTTGASPISGEVIDFMRVCFGATVVEGYGMTETACTITLTLPQESISGHVGGPLPCCEVKLDDLPEMNYTNADRPYPRGEVSSFPCAPLPDTLTCTHPVSALK